MSSKRKASVLSEKADELLSKRKPNGIKGITVADKSNDPLRDQILATLRSSGISGPVESRIVFAHTGIYVNNALFGWVGSGTSFSIRCNNAAQKAVCASFQCVPIQSEGDEKRHSNYYIVPERLKRNANQLRELAEKFIEAAPPAKTKSSSSTSSNKKVKK